MSVGTTSNPAIRVGFIPLTDAAVVIAAARLGFAAEQGLDIVLSRENSWASLRDKLIVGLIDGAHLLAPLVMATHLGVGHVRTALTVPVRLSLDGNVIVVSDRLARGLKQAGYDRALGAGNFPAALAAVIKDKRVGGDRPLTFGTVFPASSHHALMRRILAEAGLVEGREVRLVVLPPPFMVDAVASDIVDGFCVGAPWGGVAVERSLGHIVAASSEFGAGRTEKLLAFRKEWQETHADIALRLTGAMIASARWCGDPRHHGELAALLAEPSHLNLPVETIARSLAGRLLLDPGASPVLIPSFLSIGGGEVSRPDVGQIDMMLEDIGEPVSPAMRQDAAALFNLELYRGGQELLK